MYNILIIEDEEIIQQGYIAKINILNIPISNIFEASNFQQAENILNNNYIDIILCDIHLNSENGLDIIKIVKSKFENIQIIIISGYPNFKYAKKAIELGVLAYLLKPIAISDLKENLELAIKNISIYKSKNAKISFLETKYKYLDFTNELIRFFHSNNEFNEITNIPFKLDYNFILCLLCLDKSSFSNSIFFQTDENLTIFSIQNIIQELEFSNKCIVFNDSLNSNHLLILFYDTKENNLFFENVYKYCQNLNCTIKNILKINPYFSISNIYNKIDKNMYKETLDFINNRELNNFNKFIFYDEKYNTNYDLKDDLKKFKVYLENNNFSKINCLINNIINENLHINFLSNLLKEISFIIKNFDYENCDLVAENILKYSRMIGYKFANKEELIDNIITNISKVLPHNFETNVKSDFKVNLAISYINENYSSPITVSYLAQYYNLNPNYFSSIFKKITKQSVLEYLTNIRIEKAKQLLKNSEMSINDISTYVGYDNNQYFYKVFKKATGFTPLEFKNNK